jgi:hypothetical protein
MLTVLQGRCALIIVMRFQATRSCAACRLDDRAHAVASGSASIMLSMAAVRLAAIDARQSAGRPNGGFAGGSPEREISHARQSLEVNVIDRPKAMHQCVQQAPRMRGRAVSNSRQRSASGRRSISAIGAKARKIARSPRSGRADAILDAVQQDRT